MGNGKPVFYRILCRVIVFRVIDFLIHNGLDLRILGGMDGKAAAVQQVMGLGFGVPKLGH